MEIVIYDLKLLNWYTQNPAIDRSMKLMAAGSTPLRQAFTRRLIHRRWRQRGKIEPLE